MTAERLFLDEGLVARGGIGSKMELRAPIRVGDGAGDEIVVLADARLTYFRVRIFVETDDPVRSDLPRCLPSPIASAAASAVHWDTSSHCP